MSEKRDKSGLKAGLGYGRKKCDTFVTLLGFVTLFGRKMTGAKSSDFEKTAKNGHFVTF